MVNNTTHKQYVSSSGVKSPGLNRREFLKRVGCAGVGFALAFVPRKTFAAWLSKFIEDVLREEKSLNLQSVAQGCTKKAVHCEEKAKQ